MGRVSRLVTNVIRLCLVLISREVALIRQRQLYALSRATRAYAYGRIPTSGARGRHSGQYEPVPH